MRVLHVKVERGDEFLVAQALEEPGVITQGRTFDEVIANVRDAARLLLGEEDIHIELLVPADVAPDGGRRNSPRRSPRGTTPSIV